MRAVHFVLVISMLLMVAGAVIAQEYQPPAPPMEQPPMEQPPAPPPVEPPPVGEPPPVVTPPVEPPAPAPQRARVESGPVVQPRLPASADVFVGPQFAMRIAAPAGGMTPMQRAETIADRLNQAFDRGLRWEDMRVAQVGGEWVVVINNTLVATADTRSAQAFQISPSELAARWGTQTVMAMGGQPEMIAAQLDPVVAVVAGAVEELPEPWQWTLSPTRTVPLVNAATGNTIGNVMVAGAQDQLNRVNSVTLYEYAANNSVVRSFVPTGQEMAAHPVTRVPGVGVAGMPANMLMMEMPMTGLHTGPDITGMITQMRADWGTMINERLTQWNVSPRAATNIVPLYLMDEAEVIGAAQVIGAGQGVAQTQAVVVTIENNTVRFRATSDSLPVVNTPTQLQNVLVSSLIFTFEDEPMVPATPPVTPPAPPTPPSPPAVPPGTPAP